MASLAEQLKSVQLKKSSEPTKDFSSAMTAGFMTEGEIKAYEERVLEVNTERWIDLLEGETFPTVLCAFHLEEARVFMAVYERLYLNKDSEVVIATDWKENVTDAEKKILKELSSRLHEVMNVYTRDGYAFVKTSSRSAKDAPLVQTKFRQLYMAELESFLKSEQSENTQVTCLLRAAFIAMRVKTADEVIDMFIRVRESIKTCSWQL